MKFLFRTISIVALIGMVLLTAILFLSDVKLLFTRESAEYLSHITDANMLLAVMFLFIYLITLFVIKTGIKKGIILIIAFSLWLMSGRVMAYNPIADGRVITGWYYIETDKTFLCKDRYECEGLLYSGTAVKEMPFWTIKIQNKYFNKVIFIGPFTWKSVRNVIKENFERNDLR